MYQVSQEDGIFRVLKQGEAMFSPAGNPVITKNRALAERLAGHFELYGESSEEQHSIAFFHYPRLDFIQYYPRQSIEQQLVMAFDPYNDWTLKRDGERKELSERRVRMFGEASSQAQKGRLWVVSLNLDQLCAALVLGKALESVNIAYLASQAKSREELDRLIREITSLNPKFGKYPLAELFANFRFYWDLNGE